VDGETGLIFSYCYEADVRVFKVKEGFLAEEELLDSDVVLGYDADGKVVSVEVLDASKKGLLDALLELAKSKDAAKHIL
jgi:uncharacterized protein YuzE